MASIFDLFGVEGHKEQRKDDLRAEEDIRTIELANAFQKLHKSTTPQLPADKEPNWDHLLRNAKNTREKFEVMSVRDEYKAEQKRQIFEQQQAQFDRRVNGVLNTSQHDRNKAFYDELQKTSPAVYFDERVQKQRKIDRDMLGLSFHLRNK